ncbi:hypothetical protein BASA81_007335 [Batrachochytrium salamandrivorans]|nr:hypothetical protein BASA81_007335 [Batrachochytrium salamandrivorans]
MKRWFTAGSWQKAVAVAGCDSGYGLELAKKLALERPYTLVAAGCLTSEGMTRLESLQHANLVPVPLDVTSPTSIENFASRCQSLTPSWDVLITSVITTSDWYVELTDMDDYRKVMDVNYFGIVHTCKAMLPLLKQGAKPKPGNRGKPRILFVSSALGQVSLPKLSAICSAKHALGSFADSLRREVKPRFGIHVTVLDPSFSGNRLVINTWLASVREKHDKQSEERLEEYGCSREAFDQENKNQMQWYTKLAVGQSAVVNRLFDYANSTTDLAVPARITMGWSNWLLFRPIACLPYSAQDWCIAKLDRRMQRTV